MKQATMRCAGGGYVDCQPKPMATTRASATAPTKATAPAATAPADVVRDRHGIPAPYSTALRALARRAAGGGR